MPSCELWLWLLSLCVNMSEGRFWFVFGFKSVGWHRLLVPANLELRDLFNSVITFLLRTMTSSPFSVWLVCLSSISSMSFSLISEILEKCAYLGQGILYRWTEHLANFSFLDSNWGRESGPPNSTPGGGGFFGPWFFIILKNSHQDLSKEGSNFILSSLEVGHWAAQTQAFFDKSCSYLWHA